MSKLILTTSDSGAGHLKMEGVADRVIPLTPRLAWGAVPQVEDEADFPTVRDRRAERPGEDWAYWHEWERADAVSAAEPAPAQDEPIAAALPKPVWAALPNLCARHATVELWIDPTPDAQLVMIQLLSWLGRLPDLEGKLALVHADAPLGERVANGRAHLEPRDSLRTAQVDLAVRAWEAFRGPTPEPWVRLLQADTSALPHLRATVREWLEELPDAATALGATEATMLALIAPGVAGPFDVFPGYRKANTRRVFDYWEIGPMLDRLAAGPEPVVLGLEEGPFTLAMHQLEGRFDRYRASRLSLSSLGRRLAEGRDDLARHTRISRWWGGVELSPDNLWRWDARSERLLAPS